MVSSKGSCQGANKGPLEPEVMEAVKEQTDKCPLQSEVMEAVGEQQRQDLLSLR